MSSSTSSAAKVRLYNIGMLEDVVPGKVGKGMPHHNSSYWVSAMGHMIDDNICMLSSHVGVATEYPAGERCYFLNLSNEYFMKAENRGLRTKVAREYFLIAAWFAMMAADADTFDFSKYSATERLVSKEALYEVYAKEQTIRKYWYGKSATGASSHIAACRVDLMPPIAMERLSLHNELCSHRYTDPLVWKKEGFSVSARVDSVKRHLDRGHLLDGCEDHLAHLIWNFMAIYHVLVVFPKLNDLVDYDELRETNNGFE